MKESKINNNETKLPLNATDCRDDYLELYDSIDCILDPNRICINCGNTNIDTVRIGEPSNKNDLSYNYFCGFKCLVHYYIKELKKEGKL